MLQSQKQALNTSDLKTVDWDLDSYMNLPFSSSAILANLSPEANLELEQFKARKL